MPNLIFWKLPKARKQELRGSLEAYMSEHPVRDGAPIRHIGQEAKLSSFIPSLLRPMPFALILSLLLGTGTVAAAEVSHPGDFLFPVKAAIHAKLDAGVQLITGHRDEPKDEDKADMREEGQAERKDEHQQETRHDVRPAGIKLQLGATSSFDEEDGVEHEAATDTKFDAHIEDDADIRVPDIEAHAESDLKTDLRSDVDLHGKLGL